MRPALEEFFDVVFEDKPIASGDIHFGSGQTPWLVMVPTTQIVPFEQLGEQFFAQP